MSKLLIGLIFILIGICYGSLAIDDVYEHTLGYLIKNEWVKRPQGKQNRPSLLGPKQTILIYSGALIIIGLFIIWNRNN